MVSDSVLPGVQPVWGLVCLLQGLSGARYPQCQDLGSSERQEEASSCHPIPVTTLIHSVLSDGISVQTNRAGPTGVANTFSSHLLVSFDVGRSPWSFEMKIWKYTAAWGT